MTVISTIFFKDKISFGSDSLLSVNKGTYYEYEDDKEKSKIIRYEKLRAAACFWGLAKYGTWSLYDFLNNLNSNLPDTLESLANHICEELNKIFISMKIKHGIGIHLAGFEPVSGYQIPELFQITNYIDPSYKNIFDKIVYGRHSFHTITKDTKNELHGDPSCRLEVKKHLEKSFLIYNNGDPTLFNPVANAIFYSMNVLKDRKILQDLTEDQLLALARRPIEFISKFQNDFCISDQKLVGGRPHDLCIKSNGEFRSSTGD